MKFAHLEKQSRILNLHKVKVYFIVCSKIPTVTEQHTVLDVIVHQYPIYKQCILYL